MGNLQVTGCLLCSPSGEQSSLDIQSSNKDTDHHEFKGLGHNESRPLEDAAAALERRCALPPTHVQVRVPSLSIETPTGSTTKRQVAGGDEVAWAERFAPYYREHFAPPLASASLDLFAKFPSRRQVVLPAAFSERAMAQEWPSPFTQYYQEHFPQVAPGAIELYAKFPCARSTPAGGSASKAVAGPVVAAEEGEDQDVLSPAAMKPELSAPAVEVPSLPRPALEGMSFSQYYADNFSSIERAPLDLYSGFRSSPPPCRPSQAAPSPAPLPSSKAASFGAYYAANFPPLVLSEVHAKFASHAAASPCFAAFASEEEKPWSTADFDPEDLDITRPAMLSPKAQEDLDITRPAMLSPKAQEDLDVTRPAMFSPEKQAIEEREGHEELPRLMVGARAQALAPAEGVESKKAIYFGEDSPTAMVATPFAREAAVA